MLRYYGKAFELLQGFCYTRVPMPMTPEDEARQLEYYRRLARQTQVIKIAEEVERLASSRQTAQLTNPDEFSLLAMTPQVSWKDLYASAGVSEEVFLARAAECIEKDIQLAFPGSIFNQLVDAVHPEVQSEREIAVSRLPYVGDDLRRATNYMFKGHLQLVENAIESGGRMGVKSVLQHLEQPESPLRASLPFGLALKEGMPLTPTYDHTGRIGYTVTKVEGVDLKYAWVNTQPSALPKLALRVKPL